MSGQENWQVVSSKKSNTKKITPDEAQIAINSDPIIARQKEALAKLNAEKQALKQIKFDGPKDPNADWNLTTLGKIQLKPKPKQKVSQPQKEASSIKENSDGDIKIKKVSKTMAKAIVDARLNKQWTQVQLAHNSSVDKKTIGEIERGGCVYNAGTFNKLCKTLGVNIERNIDLC